MNEIKNQPEALQLADKYEAHGFLGDHRFAKDQWCSQAAAELRRQHARIAELEDQMAAIGAGGVEPLRKRAEAHDLAARQREMQLLGEIEALERLALRVLKRPGATPIAWYVTGCSTLLDEYDAKSEAKRCGGSAKAIPLYTAPQPPAVKESLTPESTVNQLLTVQVPPFTSVAQRKLDDLLARGFRITGYSIERADVADWSPQRGFITHGGMVGWWTPQAALQKALARLIAATELHHLNPLDLENRSKYNQAKRMAKQAIGLDT